VKVWLAENSGFCFGVRRAIGMAREAKDSGGEVNTLGELIHNPRIVSQLSAEGIAIATSPDAVKNKKVVIRSHGISKQDRATLEANENEIIDATCPYVQRAQQLVASNADIPVLILGDPEHPEVKGMLSWGNSLTRVVRPGEDPGEKTWKKLCIVSQTTQKLRSLQNLVGTVLPRCQELVVFNTICAATSMRQDATVALAKKADLMIVIGGKNSSNTKMLHELCSAQTRSLHVEAASELTLSDLDAAQTIGLAAGASTPEEDIWDVYQKIFNLKGKPAPAKNPREIPTYKEESC
jgi:(E)-4-hydroxy-3-methyl-but-2-enyl pyrophosphate reductase